MAKGMMWAPAPVLAQEGVPLMGLASFEQGWDEYPAVGVITEAAKGLNRQEWGEWGGSLCKNLNSLNINYPGKE